MFFCASRNWVVGQFEKNRRFCEIVFDHLAESAIIALSEQTKTNNNMTAKNAILSAKKLRYDAEQDIVFADGKNVGGADVMTREIMLKLVDESWHKDSDETLFDAIFPED